MGDFKQTDILKDLLRIKRECLLQLRDAGQKQLELIDGGDMASLMDLLSAKQRPLAALQRIERALDPFRNQDPRLREWRTDADRMQCSEQIKECETLLGEIIRQEKICEAALIRRRDEAAVQLRGAHLAGYARQAYLPPSDAQLPKIDLFSGK
jgi:hypothetical protein